LRQAHNKPNKPGLTREQIPKRASQFFGGRRIDEPKSVLTQNPHVAPSTQQAEQSWLNTRTDFKAYQSIFPEINKG
jgi:hypothetical protein